MAPNRLLDFYRPSDCHYRISLQFLAIVCIGLQKRLYWNYGEPVEGDSCETNPRPRPEPSSLHADVIQSTFPIHKIDATDDELRLQQIADASEIGICPVRLIELTAAYTQINT